MSKVRSLCDISRRHTALTVFLLGLLVSAALFVPVMIENDGLFMYYGDFNAQEIPFYQLMHSEVRSGRFWWSNLTDLGVPNASAYAFYLMASPFFYLTLPFPNEFVPYLMGPLFMLKFAFCALAAYIYLKRYVNNPTLAVAGGLLYAFSGFSIYNIFFFHFHEPMIFFPLLLAAVDAFMYDDKRGIVAPAVFCACIVNYYFFAGMAVFIAIYWFMLVFTNNYKIKLTKLLLFFLEVIVGFLATAFLLLPVVLFISGNPRISEFPDGISALAYNPPEKYWYIILSFFFPPEMAAQPNFTPDVSCNWASVSGWLPLTGMVGVVAYLQLKKRDWLKKLILVLIVMALVPVLNSMFQMLNTGIFYARWYYMFTLILILATLRALEDKDADWPRAFAWTTGITAFIALMIGIMPNTVTDDNDKITTNIGIMKYVDRYWVYVAVAFVSLAAFALMIAAFKGRRLGAVMVAGICVITLVSSSYIVQTGDSLDSSHKEFLRYNAINSASKLKIKDIAEVRSDFYECPDNLAMYYKIPSINTFHSVVAPSVMTFYDKMGMERNVASRPDVSHYGLRGLLSCKYLFDVNYDDASFSEDDGVNKMPGWKHLKSVNSCRIFENKYYIPMGFMFDSFITEEEFETIEKQYRTEASLKGLVLSCDDALKYSDITGYTKKDIKKIKKYAGKKNKKISEKADSYGYGRYQYYDDCKKLQKTACDRFSFTDEGFTASVYNSGKDNLLFFSVPYERGFTAYVNGKETEIIKSDYGFMSVRIPGDQRSEIVFKYYPAGFHTGIIISSVCGIILFMYAALLLLLRAKNKR